MNENRRRNNPADMTLTEMIIKAREEMCSGYCRYTDLKKRGQIRQETFDAICNYDCPLRKL